MDKMLTGPVEMCPMLGKMYQKLGNMKQILGKIVL